MKIMPSLIGLCLLLVLMGCQTNASHESHSAPDPEDYSVEAFKEPYTPKEGIIPDEATAVSVAEAVLVPIYGKELVDSEKPFHAKLQKNIWKVTGHMREGRKGGTAELYLQRSDGKVLRIIHGE